MEGRRHRLPRPLVVVRLVLGAFVLAWLLGPGWLRSAVPIWLVFLIALGLELHFFVGGVRPGASRVPDRGPQAVDRERYGYADESDEPDEWDGPDETDEEPWMPYAGEVDRRRIRPTVRRFLVGLGLIGALAVVLWVVESRTGWDALDADTRAQATSRFSDEASRVAAKPVTVHCDESGRYVGAVQHADGAAVVGGDVAYLTPDRCLDLYRLAFEGEVTSSRTARALAVLAHEAWHLRGVRHEGTTECYALQSAVGIGRRLGLPEETASQMMRQQLAENTLRGRGNVEYLVPGDCRDGGDLDLNPELARFP